jgi:hypothetical protein
MGHAYFVSRAGVAWRWFRAREHRPIIFAALALVAIALALRVRHLGSDAWADEAWYYYLCKTWGAQGDLVRPPDDIGAQIAYRPLFFVIHWPLAQLGLDAARLGNLSLSIGLVLATFRLALRLRLGTPLAFLSALVVAANPTCAHFGVILTTDTTTAFFLLLSVNAAVSGAYGAAAALMSAAVLCKESSVAVALAMMAGCLLERLQRTSDNPSASRLSPSLLVLGVPVLLVAVTQAVGRFAFHGRMPGWGTNLEVGSFLSHAMVGYLAAPCALILGFSRRWVLLFTAASLPIFYLAWSNLLGRGVVDWYAVSFLPLVATAQALAIRDLFVWVCARRALPAKAALTSAGAAMMLLIPWSQWWDFMHWPWQPPRRVGEREVVRALTRVRPRTVELVSCFWSLAHYPLRPSGAMAWKHYPPDEVWSVMALQRLRAQQRDVDAIVYCRPALETVLKTSFASDCVLFENDNYLVQAGPRRCAATNDRSGKRAARKRRTSPASSSSTSSPSPAREAVDSRALGAADLKLDACAILRPNGNVHVPGCRGPFVAFGPYLSLPAGSEVQVSFEVDAESDVTLYAEVVSDAGRSKHGALLPELVSEGEQQGFSFRVRLERATESLETRIVLDGERAASFELRELTVRTWLPQRPVSERRAP